MSREVAILREKVRRFAQREIACRTDLGSTTDFPFDIWHKMGEEGFMGLRIPPSYGGLGLRHPALTVACEALVRHGHNMGLALSWLVHVLVSHSLIQRFGTERQREAYLPDLSTGRISASIAVSEPGVGPHPKHLRTSAFRRGDSYVLNGEKSYLTNGTFADIFVVFAVTEKESGRNRFTAFLVPRETRGLFLTRPLHFDFLRPSPHCGIRLEECVVPADRVLGTVNRAYDEMVKPFRVLEDIHLMGGIVGGMGRQLELVVNLMRTQGKLCSDETKSRIGELRSLVEAMRVVAYEAAKMPDSGVLISDLPPLVLSFRSISNHYQSVFSLLCSESGIEANAALDGLTRDLHRTVRLARHAVAAQQIKLGGAVLFGKDPDVAVP